jgi:micrococcal nuclease
MNYSNYMGRGGEIILLIILIGVFVYLNYSWMDRMVGNFVFEKEKIHVTRVIDGDTLEGGNITVRLLGINTPERGEMYYEEAKKFLEGRVLNKTIELEYGKEKIDMYGRTLAYVYYNGELINREIVKQGYGNYYFPQGKDSRYYDFVSSWEECIENNINLCEKSKEICSGCLILEEFDWEKEKIVIKNSCSNTCSMKGWYVKDEGRKKYVFNILLEGSNRVVLHSGEGRDKGNDLFWGRKDYVWTDSGDSIFLYDDKGNLVLWESY